MTPEKKKNALFSNWMFSLLEILYRVSGSDRQVVMYSETKQ